MLAQIAQERIAEIYKCHKDKIFLPSRYAIREVKHHHNKEMI